MKFKMIFLTIMILSAILAIGAVGAADNMTDGADLDDSLSLSDGADVVGSDHYIKVTFMDYRFDELPSDYGDGDDEDYEVFSDNYSYVYGHKSNRIWIDVSDISLKPTVKIDGAEYDTKSYDQSGFCLYIPELSVGNHTLFVSHKDSEDSIFNVTRTFSLNPRILIDSKVSYGDGSKITLGLPRNATGKLEAYISDKPLNDYRNGTLYETADFINGTACIQIGNLSHGKHYIYVRYTGEDYEVGDIVNNLVEVEAKIDLPGYVRFDDADPARIYYGEDKYITIKSDKSDTRTFTIRVDGKTYGKTQLKSGNGKISLASLPLDYSSVDVYCGEKWIDSIDVIVVPPKLVGKNVNMYYNDGSKYSVKVYSPKLVGKGKVVTIKIGNKNYKVKTNAKGTTTLKITNAPGKYKITVKYGITISNKLVIRHALKLNKVKVKKSAKRLVLKATLKQGNKVLKNKKVTFKFNSKKYNAKTNNKGIAKITIKKSVLKNLKAGKKVRFQATYLKDTVKRTAKVKK